MREIYQITHGDYQGKFCYIVNRLTTNFRVCIGEDNQEESYVKIPKEFIKEDDPLPLAEILNMLNGKHMEEGKHE